MASGQYTHTTLQALVDQLAADLSDPAQKFFTSTELQYAVVDALRLSSVLTARERHTLSFNASAGVAWYDLRELAPMALESTVTDRTLISKMQYMLMEPVEPSTGAGMTERYTFDELLRSLQQSHDRFLVDTECVVTRHDPITPISVEGVVQLDESVAKVRRAVWIDRLNRRTVLRNPTDEGIATAANLERRTSPQGTPRRWALAARPQLELQLDPVPLDTSPLQSLELWTVDTAGDLDTTANSNTGTVLGVPDDLAFGLIWDTFARVLTKHGMGHDSARAQVADRLGTFVRSLAETLPVVLQVAVNGVDVRVGEVAHLDAKECGWEGGTPGIPRRAVTCGDWMALYPVPDDSFSVEVTLVSKLPTLALTDFVQIGREHLSGILAWAKQTLLFKVGGQPLASAVAAAGLLIEQARSFNEERIRSCAYLKEFLSSATPKPPTLSRSAPPPEGGDEVDNASSRNTRNRNPRYSPYAPPIGGRR